MQYKEKRILDREEIKAIRDRRNLYVPDRDSLSARIVSTESIIASIGIDTGAECQEHQWKG